MFVNKSDYKGSISTDLLNILLAEDEAVILASSSKTAEDTIKTYAGALYDIDAELAKVGNARNHYLLSLAISIALYNIYQRADDEEVPAKVIKNYEDAIDDLQNISRAKMSLNLSSGSGDDDAGGGGSGEEGIEPGGKGTRRIGSQPRRTHNI